MNGYNAVIGIIISCYKGIMHDLRTIQLCNQFTAFTKILILTESMWLRNRGFLVSTSSKYNKVNRGETIQHSVFGNESLGRLGVIIWYLNSHSWYLTSCRTQCHIHNETTQHSIEARTQSWKFHFKYRHILIADIEPQKSCWICVLQLCYVVEIGSVIIHLVI